MAITVIFTKSTQLKLKQDPWFSNFIDDAMLQYRHKEYNYSFDSLVDFNAWYGSSAYSEYYYQGGYLVVSTSRSDGNTMADWFPSAEQEE